MDVEPAILTEALTKHYGDVAALVDLDLEVRRGEVFGFLGPNGAGKTTTIRTLTDEIRPTSGRAAILGMDTREQSVEIRRHLGYLPGDLALYPRLTGRETLQFFGNLRGGIDWDHVELLAERLGADLGRKVGEYSTGNRQKLGLVQAFMHRPAVLIMDEPSAGLDPLVQREFQAMVREFAGEGGTVFLSSHTLSEVQRVADRVGVIRAGRLVAVESVADLRAKAVRRVEFTFAEPPDADALARVEGVHAAEVDGNRVVLSYGGPMAPLLRAVVGHEILDITTREADLEEVFLTFYEASPPDSVPVGP